MGALSPSPGRFARYWRTHRAIAVALPEIFRISGTHIHATPGAFSDKYPLLNQFEGECHVAQNMDNAALLVVNGSGLRWRK
jgi:hypothetical protein